jgi:hypothetical protein
MLGMLGVPTVEGSKSKAIAHLDMNLSSTVHIELTVFALSDTKLATASVENTVHTVADENRAGSRS